MSHPKAAWNICEIHNRPCWLRVFLFFTVYSWPCSWTWNRCWSHTNNLSWMHLPQNSLPPWYLLLSPSWGELWWWVTPYRYRIRRKVCQASFWMQHPVPVQWPLQEQSGPAGSAVPTPGVQNGQKRLGTSYLGIDTKRTVCLWICWWSFGIFWSTEKNSVTDNTRSKLHYSYQRTCSQWGGPRNICRSCPHRKYWKISQPFLRAKPADDSCPNWLNGTKAGTFCSQRHFARRRTLLWLFRQIS